MTIEVWTVIAGIAQIFAACFAAYTIYQAVKMLAQADFQIKLSVAPDWDVRNHHIGSPEFDHKKMNHVVNIVFMNTGFGPARNLIVSFTPNNGNEPIKSEGIGDPAIIESIVPNDIYGIKLYWDYDKPLDGILMLTSTTRLGNEVVHRFRVCTYLDQKKEHTGWCDIEPLNNE